MKTLTVISTIKEQMVNIIMGKMLIVRVLAFPHQWNRFLHVLTLVMEPKYSPNSIYAVMLCFIRYFYTLIFVLGASLKFCQ